MGIIINPTRDEIQEAAKALIDGHLVAFPTETVYGLGADATNEKAVGRVYSVKARPIDHPLIVHISSINQLDKWAIEIPEYAIKLAEEFWPGPMTLILKRSKVAKDFITGGQENVGVRVPSHPVALGLLGEFEKLGGLGVAAPSANRFGAVSPTTLSAVHDELRDFLSGKDSILNGGSCLVGVESTIIDCSQGAPVILRPGVLTLESIEKCIGIQTNLLKSEVKTSGLLESHYSPKATVVLDAPASLGDGFIALETVPTPIGAIRLASPATIEQFAKVIYEALRLGDRKGIRNIIVIQPNGNGLALAIRDRLGKAANS